VKNYKINHKEMKLIGQVLMSKRLTEQSRSFVVETIRRFLAQEILLKEHSIENIARRNIPEYYEEITKPYSRGERFWYRNIIIGDIREFVEENPDLMIYPRLWELREAMNKHDEAEKLLAAFDSAVGYTDGE